MSQAEKEQADQRKAKQAHYKRERASGNRLWSVYVSESQIYEKDLIQGWRSEMEGLLTFAGIFSGVVTIFIIESYKTLNINPADQTLALLSQILHPSVNQNNGTVVMEALSPTSAFSPPLSSLVCNALWFISLTLTLLCAFVATLIKQWAQEFPRRVVMLSSPSIWSRTSLYLNYGFRRFNMHIVVRLPLLCLQEALVLFFAGLVPFLAPVNSIIMGTCSAVPLGFFLAYGAFTVLPLYHPNIPFPFHTPLAQMLLLLKQDWGSELMATIGMLYTRKRVAVMDPEANETLDSNEDDPFMHKSKRGALRPDVAREIEALAWTVQSLSDDDKLLLFVEGLPEALWDFDQNKPRGVYQAHFKILLRDPEVHLDQRLADFMAGSNSNLLERKDRLRRQLSVLRAIWAICAFFLHTGSPLPSPIGEANVDKALLGSKFIDSPDVQSMVPDVSALVRLNMIAYRSREWHPTHQVQSIIPDVPTLIRLSRAFTQPSDSDDDHFPAEAYADMHRTYTSYLLALSQCTASFQREQTVSLFHRSTMRFTDGYCTLQDALEHLIRSASDETADNVVFAARQMISPFAQTSEYPSWSPLPGLGRFVVRHPSLAASDLDSDSQPASKYHYTRYLCHKLCDNLKWQSDHQECVDALQLIYRNLLESDVPPSDLDTHLLVLRTLRTKTADIRTHRLVAIVQCVALMGNLSKTAELLRIFDDKDWFRSMLGLENDERMERASAQQVHGFASVGVVTTFFEQCAARSPDQTERDLDFETLELLERHTDMYMSPVIPTGLQRRFADAVSGFIRKYPEDCLVDRNALEMVLYRAVDEDNGWIDDADALHALDTAVSEVQPDQSYKFYAREIRRQIQKRLSPNNIFAASVSLDSDEE
ncbi:unnamed protein product [Mycena citricolor]|uniref:DUF6535 domain-containing protein n=1 Tax=Mycena citricolor TaxID=2018698 RepID=A0AAD2K4F8_9AGAR|nr:unnamed protein product [Mycena citricolor]